MGSVNSKKGHFTTNSFLHREVWAYYNGEIPKGYVVHHKDRDKFNNNVENLQVMTAKEHLEIHKYDAIAARKRKEFICEVCGKTFLAYDVGINRYCSKTCTKKARNILPNLMVEVTCAICGKKFFRRKDKTSKTCSPKCCSALRLKDYVPVPQTVERSCVVCGKKIHLQQIQTHADLFQKMCAKTQLD